MKKLLGGILLAAGILIGGASGLCTLVFLVMGLSEGINQYTLSMLPAVLVVGGIPLAAGIGLFFGGRALLESARKDEAAEQLKRRFE
jgi:hypothetical protein